MAATEDLFTPIHKGLRSMLYSLSTRLQTNDFADAASTQALVTDLENDFAVARSAGCTLCVLAHHATDEEDVIFGPVAKAGGSLVTTLISEHHDLTRREVEIARAAHDLISTTSATSRVAAGVRLNQAANELFAAYVAHMNREETELVPLMQGQFTDAEMVAMRGAIMARMPPDRLFAILGWMLPSLNVSELSELLTSVAKTAPPPLLKAITELGAAKVDPARWRAVKLRTGL